MIKIIVDSTAYTPKDYAKEHDISIVPLRYLYKDQEYVEGMPGSFDEFFKDFTESKVFPKTSQPSIELFIEEYNKAIDDGNEVLVFTVSSTVSGTFNGATLAKNQCKAPEKVTVFDSQALAQTILGYVMEAVKMRDAGKSVEEIVERLTTLQENSLITFVPDTLEYIYKGGRIGKVTATIGSILQIKPIISFQKGVLSDKKCFGLQKAMREMVSNIPQKLKRLFILHIANARLFDTFKAMVMDVINKREDKDSIEIYEGEVGPVIATYAGPAVGLAWTSE